MSKTFPVALPDYERVGRPVVVLAVQNALQRIFDAGGDLREVEAAAKAVGEVSGVPEPGTGLTVLASSDRKLTKKLIDRALAGAKAKADSDEGEAIVVAVNDGYYDGSVNPRKIIVAELPATEARLRLDIERRVEDDLIRREARRQADAYEAGSDAEPAAVYVDIAAVLKGDMSTPEPDAGGIRADGERMLYRGKVNGLVGEGEVAKSIAAACMVADELHRDGSALWVDLDHNGAQATLGRLLAAGVGRKVLRDPSRFRLVLPESRAGLLTAIDDAADWSPTMAVVDSVGEVVPMFGGDSNNADDYTRVHREVFARLADAGAAVLVIDHLAKTALSTGYASGTGAKKRAMDGAYYGVKLVETFRPGVGGASAFTILKDRHGGVRAKSPSETAAVFRLDSRGDEWTWEFHPGRSEDERAADGFEQDVATVLALVPFPSTRTALQGALRATAGKGWNNERARLALAEATTRRTTTFPLDPRTTDK